MERTNIQEEMLLKDGVYTTQPVYSECRVNSIETNQFNRHIGSSLPEDGVYTAKPVYLECRVNSLQKNTLNGHVGSSLQHELLRYALDLFLNCLRYQIDQTQTNYNKSFANESFVWVSGHKLMSSNQLAILILSITTSFNLDLLHF
ncbi:hypothetical protein Godav_024153 [Gossypium davidsonii]|uniref:Uncharacterized protein n=1 Tax=Gossypium davidsonii TaxID=34287 RepID=A0A7J8SU60_GOSDV|nr:hypothetical protein [Gossypium davidsonii]